MGEQTPLVSSGPPPYTDGALCSTDYHNGPFPDGATTWHRYGARGGVVNNLASCHNKGYASGFSTAQTWVRIMLAPLTIPAAWIWGFMIATFSIFAQIFVVDGVARLFGEVFGTIVLECMGKRRYYQKKSLYYELATLEMQSRNSGLQPGVQII